MDFMKRLMLLALLIYGVSCSNPEDRATGNPDSTSFNKDEKKVLNSRPGPTDPNSQSAVETPDTSASPATSKENANSTTKGTNRSYGAKRDTSKQK